MRILTSLSATLKYMSGKGTSYQILSGALSRLSFYPCITSLSISLSPLSLTHTFKKSLALPSSFPKVKCVVSHFKVTCSSKIFLLQYSLFHINSTRSVLLTLPDASSKFFPSILFSTEGWKALWNVSISRKNSLVSIYVNGNDDAFYVS